MSRRLYDWAMREAAGPRAVPALAVLSFAESSFFPLPPEVMLVPMCLADRRRALYFAAICTIASVLGGLAGYAIGYYTFETIGLWIIRIYGGGDKFESLRNLYQEWGFWFILIKGLTPIPYKLVTIASGVFKLDLSVFVIASIITRGIRFFAEAALLHFYGEPVRTFIERHLGPITWISLFILIGAYVAVRYLL